MVTEYDSGTPPEIFTAGAVQVAVAGTPEQLNEALPLKPVPGTNCKLKTAVCPAVTVTEFAPGAAGEIVSAEVMDEVRPSVCGELGASSVIAIKAARAPVVRVESDTPMVHVAPTA